MGKGSRNNRYERRMRGTIPTPNLRLHRPTNYPILGPAPRSVTLQNRLNRVTAMLEAVRLLQATTPLMQIEDRRQWHPQGAWRPAKSLNRANHLLRLPKGKRGLPSSVSFEEAHRVAVCVRRKKRREVLHALRRTGRPGRKTKAPVRNWLSSIHC